MHKKFIKYLNPSVALIAVGLVTAAATAIGQTPAPSPSPSVDDQNYIITSSVELGARGLSVNGDHEKYQSDLNYRAGFRVFDSSFFVEDHTKTGYKLFDSALVTTTGWFSDPQGSFRLNMSKAGIYKFDSNIRRVRYFNDLKTHAVNWSQTVPTGSEHDLDTLHHMGDFDLTIFPERKDFRLKFGYSFSNTEGPGDNTFRFKSDEFEVNDSVNYTSHDLRVGVEGQLLGFNLGVDYGHRHFGDGTRFSNNGLNQGNNPATSTAFITLMSRDLPVKGSTDFGNFWFQRTFAKTFDVTGRFIYANTESTTTQSDFIQGRVSSTGDFINNDSITAPGNAKRPQARSDLGVTWQPTDRLRISNTFTFDQFSISGFGRIAELVQSTSSTGQARPDAFTDAIASRGTWYRRLSNLIEGDYQVNHWLAFNVGYRYTHRRVAEYALDVNNLNLAVTAFEPTEDNTNTTNSIIAGTRFKPYKFWSIYADVEHGNADNVFTRLANNDFTNFRLRSITNLKNWTINVSGIVKDNDSPGLSNAIDPSQGGGFPSIPTIASTKSRTFTASVDWAINQNWDLDGGYTYAWQNSDTTIIVPLGTPYFTSTRFVEGVSQYYMRDNYVYIDLAAHPFRRVSMYLSYRYDQDNGQGNKTITRPQDIITSYPFKFHMPEARLAIKLTRNIDWNLGYQYYGYSETPYFNPFTAVQYPTAPTPYLFNQLFPAQNYTAHLPYTSLRIYWGGKADERFQ